MERSTPIGYDPEKTGKFQLCAYLPPHKEYRARIATFPAANANKAWEEEGIFFTTSEIYCRGKQVASIHTECVNQDGYISIDYSDITAMMDQDESSMVIVSMYHDKKIPLETYAAYHHRSTGGYISFPVAMFIGDRIYTHSHADRLENTVFWPGLVINDNSESCLIVANPFQVNFNYQLSLYKPDGTMQQSEVFRLKKYSLEIHDIGEVFSEFLLSSELPSEHYAICVSAQYKIISYFGIRDKQQKFFTTLDHMHPFIMV